jgi:ATP-dependent helicase/nuclease subunit A
VSLKARIPQNEWPAFDRASALYGRTAETAATTTLCGLVTHLWYNEGCRYETLWNAGAQSYAALYDALFELARAADSQGMSLALFLDLLDQYDAGDLAEGSDIDMSLPPDPSAGGTQGSVTFMTVHKSKGLEFPVVFIYGGNNPGRNNVNDKSVYFSPEYGVSVNLRPAEGVPTDAKVKPLNYFFQLAEDNEKAQTEAELKRLFYVAATRAEKELYFTASYKEVKEKIANKKDEDKETETDKKARTFLDLAKKAGVPAGASGVYTVDEIPAYTKAALHADSEVVAAPPDLRTAIEKAAPLYADKSRLERRAPPAVLVRSASSEENNSFPTEAGAEKTVNEADVDFGFPSKDFGTIAHAYIQALSEKAAVVIPPRLEAALSRLPEERRLALLAEAERMRDRFAGSELGKMALNADLRESEFPVVVYEKNLITNGVIDLLFEDNNVTHVIDFKTDRDENPTAHAGQLAVYKKAVSAIYKKAVRCWLFYLRTGHAIEVSV